MRKVSLACALVVATTATISIARAQDPAKVDARHYQVLIDNERTRVFRVVVGPGEKVPMHEHPDAIAIPLDAKAGGAYFIPAQKHEGGNPGTSHVDFIYIELKGNGGADRHGSGEPTGHQVDPPPRECKGGRDRVTVDSGFSEPAGTTHDYEQVAVALGDTEYSLTVDGKTTNTWKRGDVAFIGRNVRHQSKNAGKPVDFVIVAIK